MGLFKGKDKLSIFQRKHETYLYELVMEEIAKNERQKGIWGQAIVKSNGDEKKAEAEYIKLRVESLKDELEIQEQEEIEKATIQEELDKIAKEEKEKKAKEKAKTKQQIKLEKENEKFDKFMSKYIYILILVILPLYLVGMFFGKSH